LFRGTRKLGSQNVSVRFVRVWVERPEGWKLIVYQETTKAEKTPEKRSGFGSPSDGGPVVCDNPCQNIPYKPEDPRAREITSMWQKVEQTVLSNDVNAWIPNFTDDFVFVTPDGGPPLNKEDRVTMIKDLKRSNTILIPAEVVSMKVWVFGDAAVMRSEHKSHRGTTLHIARVFTKTSGHWQIAFGQQTAIQ
jgi:ketosteroid isomerase-like protein